MKYEQLLGNLTLRAIPYHNNIIIGAGIFIGCVSVIIIGLLFCRCIPIRIMTNRTITPAIIEEVFFMSVLICGDI